jgi:hypothetical protein
VQRAPLDELHHDELVASDLAALIRGDDVGMVQSPRRLRFAFEAQLDLIHLRRLEPRIEAQHFQRDVACHRGIVRAEHHAHSAAT